MLMLRNDDFLRQGAQKHDKTVSPLFTNDDFAPLGLDDIEAMAKVSGRPLLWAMVFLGFLLFASALCANTIGRLERFEALYGESKSSSSNSENAIDELLAALWEFDVNNERTLIDLIPHKKTGNRPTTLWIKDRPLGADLYLDERLLDNLEAFDWEQTLTTHRRGDKVELVVYRPRKNSDIRANGYILDGTKEVNDFKVQKDNGHYTIFWLDKGKKKQARVISLSSLSSIPSGAAKHLMRASDGGSAVGGQQTEPSENPDLQKLLLALQDFSSSSARHIIGLAGPKQILWHRIGSRCELFASEKLVDYVTKNKWDRVICSRRRGKELRLVVYRHEESAELRVNGFIIPSSRKVQWVKADPSSRHYRITFVDDRGRNCFVDVPTLEAIADVPTGSRKRLKLNVQGGATAEDHEDENHGTGTQAHHPYGSYKNLTASEIESIVDKSYRRNAKAGDGLYYNEWGVAVGRSKTAIISHAGTVDGFKNRYECLIAHSKEVRSALAKAVAEKKKAAAKAE